MIKMNWQRAPRPLLQKLYNGQYCDRKYPQQAIEIYTEMFGDYATIHIFFQFESLAEFEKIAEESQADEEFQALVRKGGDVLVAGTARNIILQSIWKDNVSL